MPWPSKPSIDLARNFRTDLIKAAAGTNTAGMIVTFAGGSPGARDVVTHWAKIVEDARGRVTCVELTCAYDELLKRLSAPSRQGTRKCTSKEELDAVKTAFSAYQEYGIGLLNVTHFYYLPKKMLTKEDILKHSLYIAEKDMDTRYLIFIALFYAKYKKEFKTKHPILINISTILVGGEVKGYPKYQEIKDRAEVYKIKV